MSTLLEAPGERSRGFFIPLELGTGSTLFSLALPVTSAGTKMIDPHFENRSGYRSGYYSRWPNPWQREDDWGRSPPQLCFSLSWLDSSSTAPALIFRSLCVGGLRAARLIHRTRPLRWFQRS